MQTYWSGFARSGTPNSLQSPAWIGVLEQTILASVANELTSAGIVQ